MSSSGDKLDTSIENSPVIEEGDKKDIPIQISDPDIRGKQKEAKITFQNNKRAITGMIIKRMVGSMEEKNFARRKINALYDAEYKRFNESFLNQHNLTLSDVLTFMSPKKASMNLDPNAPPCAVVPAGAPPKKQRKPKPAYVPSIAPYDADESSDSSSSDESEEDIRTQRKAIVPSKSKKVVKYREAYKQQKKNELISEVANAVFQALSGTQKRKQTPAQEEIEEEVQAVQRPAKQPLYPAQHPPHQPLAQEESFAPVFGTRKRVHF